MGQKNLLYKIITSLLGRKNDKALVNLAGPAHLAGKSSGVLAAAIMAQMELDYAQFVAEEDPDDIRCVLTTDAKTTFQSASRNNCYNVLCTTRRGNDSPHSLLTHIRALSESFGQQQT